MEQYIPYSLSCDLFSRNIETYLYIYIYTFAKDIGTRRKLPDLTAHQYQVYSITL